MNEKKDDKKGCGHTGKWSGNGQNVLNAGNTLVVVSSAICGECGKPVISINNIKLEGVSFPSNRIVTPFNMPVIKK